MKSVAAVIVAAGSSSRLGQPKQLLMYEGEPMLQHAIRIALEAWASPVFVVLGAYRELIESRVDLARATIVVNEEWAEGLSSSVRAGVRTAEKDAPESSGVLLMICDQPRVTAEHLRKMMDAFAAQKTESAVASVYADARGIPAIFPRSSFANLCALQGDKGARGLLAEATREVVEVPLEGGEIDLDRPEDLDQLR